MRYYIIPQLNHPSVSVKSYGTMGFFAKFGYVLEALLRMEAIMKETGEELIPYIDFETRPSTLRDETNNETKNEWEYCFIQEDRYKVFGSPHMIMDASFYAGNYPDGQPKPILKINPGGKNFNDKELVKGLGELIKKYFKIRPEVSDKLNNEIKKNKTLGVHCRRSELHLLHDNIALKYENETYFEKIMKVFEENGFEKIYLATEEIDIINYFKEKIPDLLLYQEDCYRILRHESPFQGAFRGIPRDKHFTLHAQEVLIDAINLSKCDSLLCGISGVSNGATYINGLKYNNVFYFDEI